MPTLDPLQIALLCSALVLLSGLWLRQRRHATGQPKEKLEELDTVQAWPPQAVRVMTFPERRALEVLRKALPGSYLVLAQVPLARFISVPVKHSHQEWQKRVGRLSADLVVCDKSSRVIAVVEIRGGEESPRSRQRHARLARVLEAAGIPVHVWSDAALPAPAEARKAILPKFGPVAPGASEAEPSLDNGGRAVLPIPEIEELLADGDAFMRGNVPDPVASGYFDDLDAASAAPAR
jgi:hypothetical protein